MQPTDFRPASYTYEQQLDRQIADAERELRMQQEYIANLRARRAALCQH